MTSSHSALRTRRALASLLASTCALACGGAEFVAGPSDASHADAAIDAGAGDASADGGARDGGGSYCAQHQGQFVFCADFDEGALPDVWDGVKKSGDFAGTLTIDTGNGKSPPGSLLFSTPALASGAATQAIVSKGQLGRGAGRVELDFFVESLSFPDPNDPIAGEQLFTVWQGKDYSLRIDFRPSPGAPFALVLTEVGAATDGAAVAQHPLKAVPPVATWAHLRLDFGFGALNGSATVQLDANPAETVALAPPASAAIGERLLTVGLTAAGAIGEVRARVDDVTYATR